jgi:hypothetical protein
MGEFQSNTGFVGQAILPAGGRLFFCCSRTRQPGKHLILVEIDTDPKGLGIANPAPFARGTVNPICINTYLKLPHPGSIRRK